MDTPDKPIVFFDGYCGICNRFVDFMFRVDKKHVLLFTPLQGETAKALFPNGELERFDSIAFYKDGKLSWKSVAVLRILTTVKRGWQLMAFFYILPRFLRNWLYDWVAKNRYSWFGKKETCRMPTPEEREKLLP